jgi:hypothetical protein
MAGLLDFLNTDDGRLGLSLLAAAGPSMQPTSFGDRLQGALGSFDGYKQGQMKTSLLQSQIDENASQAAQRRALAQAETAKLARQQAMQSAIPGLFGAVPQGLGGQGGQPGPVGGFDVQRALQLGMTPDEIQKYVGLQDVGRPKATRQIEVDDGQGGKRIALVDDFGREVAGMAGYVAPVQVQQGDRVTFAKPAAGLSLPVGMSPAERDASARGWANVNISRDQANTSKAPAGYRFKADGSMEVIPGGPADQRASAEGQKKASEAKDVLGLLDEVDKLLPKATGSYVGAGVDQAARLVGKSTPGAEATAQLKTLQGALISKMPKMSGPQSDKDVQLYREMAGQVADSTLPVGQRQKASEMIRSLNEKYAGMQPGESKGAVTVVKTGMYGGRKVKQMSDGSVQYAD